VPLDWNANLGCWTLASWCDRATRHIDDHTGSSRIDVRACVRARPDDDHAASIAAHPHRTVVLHRRDRVALDLAAAPSIRTTRFATCTAMPATSSSLGAPICTTPSNRPCRTTYAPSSTSE